jgi:Protein of unknown function (DUF3108)
MPDHVRRGVRCRNAGPANDQRRHRRFWLRRADHENRFTTSEQVRCAYNAPVFEVKTDIPADKGMPFVMIFSLSWFFALASSGYPPAKNAVSAPQKSDLPTSMRAVPAAQIIPPSPSYRFPDDRSYVYSVEWHLFTAGTATVKMEPAGPEQKVTAVANSQGVVNALYGVRDRFEARFDPRTFCSLRVFKHSEEGSHKRETEIRFDYSRRTSTLYERNLKTGETKHTENDIPGCVTDVVSGFFYVASLPLQPGGTYRFPMNDGNKTAEVLAHVETREQIKTPEGIFPTLRVAAEAISGTLKGRGKIWVWFTDDGNRTPVQMRAKLGWGTLLFRLQRLNR